MNADIATRPRWERRKEARPSELTAAALELFVERGFAATRLEDIAARAGVSKGTLYLYFAGKEELFEAVVREGLLPALAQGEELVRGFEGSSSDLLRRVLQGWWELIGSQPIGGLPKLMISEARNVPRIAQFYYDEVIVRGQRLLRAVLARGQARGEFRAGEIDLLQTVAFAPFLMFVVWRHSLACCDAAGAAPERYIEAAIDFALRGLAAPPEGSVP
jgi:AcrR family transcriptional regulator